MFLPRFLRNLVPPQSPLRLAWHRSKAFFAALRYGFPAQHLMVIAVTGTDGKTTTVGMIAHILKYAGMRAGVLSTAFFSIGEEQEWNATQKTSPSPFLIQKFFRRLKNAGCTHAVLEVSSHGLVQGRLNFTWPVAAALTNVTPEHLDYHGTMERYRADKGRLFRMLKIGGTKVLNRDDGSFDFFNAIPSSHTITTSVLREADLQASDIQENAEGVQATVTSGKMKVPARPRSDGESGKRFDNQEPITKTQQLSLRIPGAFNVENALLAIGCAEAMGIPMEKSVEALRSFPGIPGRMEKIDEGQPFSVYVDFTVTPAAYEKTLTALKRTLAAGGRLLVLTGSCGDRMREKRPVLGRIVSALADIVVVTSDETYGEPHERIIADVWAGIDQSKTQAHRIVDRRDAIAFLLKQARPADCVAICGMAGTVTMMTAKGQIPWDERQITRELLRGLR